MRKERNGEVGSFFQSLCVYVENGINGDALKGVSRSKFENNRNIENGRDCTFIVYRK